MCGYGSGYSLPNFSLGSLRVSVQALSSQLAGRLPPTALVKPESTVWPWASLKSCFPPQSGWLCSLLVLSRPSRLCPGFGCLSWFVLLFLHFLEAQQMYRRPVHVISASLECLALALAWAVGEFGDSDDHSLYPTLSREILSWGVAVWTYCTLEKSTPRHLRNSRWTGSPLHTGLSAQCQEHGNKRAHLLSFRPKTIFLPSKVILDHCHISKENFRGKKQQPKPARPSSQVSKQGADRKLLNLRGTTCRLLCNALQSWWNN